MKNNNGSFGLTKSHNTKEENIFGGIKKNKKTKTELAPDATQLNWQSLVLTEKSLLTITQTNLFT